MFAWFQVEEQASTNNACHKFPMSNNGLGIGLMITQALAANGEYAFPLVIIGERRTCAEQRTRRSQSLHHGASDGSFGERSKNS